MEAVYRTEISPGEIWPLSKFPSILPAEIVPSAAEANSAPCASIASMSVVGWTAEAPLNKTQENKTSISVGSHSPTTNTCFLFELQVCSGAAT
jgi:hypothetical protein